MLLLYSPLNLYLYVHWILDPLSKISECIDALAVCEYFSCLDMANGYYQIKMEGEDRDKTAFVKAICI